MDLDDYNHEVEEGLHITSMAGTWMSIVEGFGGMRIKNDTISFETRIPSQWKSYSFKVNFRNQVLKVSVTQNKASFELVQGKAITILVNDKSVQVTSENLVII